MIVLYQIPYWVLENLHQEMNMQILQLDTVFQAIETTAILPVCAYVFTSYDEGYPAIDGTMRKISAYSCDFGHLGGTNWIEVIKFAKAHHNVYLDLSAALHQYHKNGID